MSASDIPPVPSSILRKKGSVDKFIDSTSKHTLETRDNCDGTITTSITKRAKVPSTNALIAVPTMPESRFTYTGKVYGHEDRTADEAEKRYLSKKYNEQWRAHHEELGRVNHENCLAGTLAKYESNNHPDRVNIIGEMQSDIKNHKKQKRGRKDWFPDKNTTIYDASYQEINDKILGENESQNYKITKAPRKPYEAPRKASKNDDIGCITGEDTSNGMFKKAPSKDARGLGLANRNKYHEEPAGIAAINESKRKVKSSLVKKDPSKKFRNNNNNDSNWLIDKSFDELAGVGKAVGKVAGKAVRVGFKGAKTGIRAVGGLAGEFEKTPMARNIMAQAEADMLHIRSAGRRARGSIIATGNYKRPLTLGSLVTQRGFGNSTNAPQFTNVTDTRVKIIPKVVRRGNRDVILYFLENGQQVTARQAQLIRDGLLNPFRANGSLTTTAKENLTYDSGTITKKPVSASELVTRKHGGLGTNQVDNPVLNKTKTATPAGLVTINQSGVGTYQSNGNIVDDSEHTPIGEITRKTTASGIVTRAKNGLGATQMSNNPVLNITQIASPSRLMRSRHSGVV